MEMKVSCLIKLKMAIILGSQKKGCEMFFKNIKEIQKLRLQIQTK